MVAWDGGEPASRAARRAIPLLAKCKSVTIVCAPVAGRTCEGGRLKNYYAARGLKASVKTVDAGADPSHALLEAAGSRLDTEAVARHIMDGGQFAGQAMTRRLALLVEKLNEMHYQAHWEAGAGGPRVVLGRCPYAKLIEAHPEICNPDASLMRGALGREVLQVKRGDASTRSSCPFIFETAQQ